jgi:hypothetical protein
MKGEEVGTGRRTSLLLSRANPGAPGPMPLVACQVNDLDRFLPDRWGHCGSLLWPPGLGSSEHQVGSTNSSPVGLHRPTERETIDE